MELSQLAAIFLLITGMATLIFCVVLVVKTQKYMAVGFERGKNDDGAAIAMFQNILRDAESNMIIHDDGDDAEGSVYNDEATIALLRNRLKENPKLTIKCLFNVNGDLQITTLAKEKEIVGRLLIKYRKGGRPQKDVHYKIIDDGRKGHLSMHGLGEKEREYELIDCTDASQNARNKMLGEYRKHFDEEFLAAQTGDRV